MRFVRYSRSGEHLISNVALAKDNDSIGTADNRAPMSNQKNSTTTGKAIKCGHQRFLRSRVQRRRGFIENYDRRVLYDSTSDCQSLLLASGQCRALLPHDSVIALRQPCNELVRLCGLGGPTNLVLSSRPAGHMRCCLQLTRATTSDSERQPQYDRASYSK